MVNNDATPVIEVDPETDEVRAGMPTRRRTRPRSQHSPAWSRRVPPRARSRGGCPHTAIREDASINLAGVAKLNRDFPGPDLILLESGGDNLSATFSPDLADITIYVIDVSGGEDPPQGYPRHYALGRAGDQQDRPRPHVSASLAVTDRDSRTMRGERPFVFCNLKAGAGVEEVASFIGTVGGLAAVAAPST